jgi:hypothetical protein
MVHEHNGQRGYRVIVSESTRSRLKVLILEADQTGFRDQFLATLAHFMARLQDDPHDVGEPMYHYAHLDSVHCVALRDRVKIHFSIHEHLPVVWLTDIDIV